MLDNRVKETTTTTGTGNLTTAGAVTNFQTFNSAFGLNVDFKYWIIDSTNNIWETGVGYLSDATTLVRETILDNSSGTQVALSLSAGTKDVFCAPSGADNPPILQVLNVQDGDVATGTTIVVNDDTIPQSTEGDQYMSLAITPQFSTSKLKIEVNLNLAHSSTVQNMVAFLLKDSDADALAVQWQTKNNQANQRCSMSFIHYMEAGSTSAITFKVRAGATTSGTTTFNGVSGTRKFGGTFASSIVITEIAPTATGGVGVQSGRMLQVVNTTDGAVATGTTVMNDDNTIPQNTEGTEFMTVAITPKFSNSKLKIEVFANYASNIANNPVVALFQDSVADALAAVNVYNTVGNGGSNDSFIHFMEAGTTSEITFKVRIGMDRSGTLTFNGVSGSRTMGGVMASSITVTEIAA